MLTPCPPPQFEQLTSPEVQVVAYRLWKCCQEREIGKLTLDDHDMHFLDSFWMQYMFAYSYNFRWAMCRVDNSVLS